MTYVFQRQDVIKFVLNSYDSKLSKNIEIASVCSWPKLIKPSGRINLKNLHYIIYILSKSYVLGVARKKMN